jgi:putative FmdB family regulatory protein
MPIYEYQCQECEHLFDALQKINEKPLLDCPSCGEDALKRLISAPNFRLKGKGWYETDFKKENQKNLADSKEDKSSKAEDKGTKKKSDQPEKKKASKDKAPKDKE